MTLGERMRPAAFTLPKHVEAHPPFRYTEARSSDTRPSHVIGRTIRVASFADIKDRLATAAGKLSELKDSL